MCRVCVSCVACLTCAHDSQARVSVGLLSALWAQNKLNRESIRRPPRPGDPRERARTSHGDRKGTDLRSPRSPIRGRGQSSSGQRASITFFSFF